MSIQPYSEKALAAAKQKDKKALLLNAVSGEIPKPIIPYTWSHRTGESASNEPVRSLAVLLPDRVAGQALRVSNGSDMNVHALATAAAALLVYKYSGCEDFLLGIPSTVVRIHLQSGMTFKELLLDTRKRMAAAHEYKDYPLEVIATELGLTWGPDDNPFFDVAVMMNNIHDPTWMREVPSPFVMAASRDEHSLRLTLHFQPRLYDEAAARRFLDHYIYLFDQALSHPDIPLAQLAMADDSDLKMQAPGQIGECAGPDRQVTLHHMFEWQAAARPDHTALVYGSQHMTYRELNERAERIAGALRHKGVTRETIVAVMAERSFDMVASILGVLKAGGAYLPVEPSLPEERIRYMLEDCRAKYLLTSKSIHKAASMLCESTIYLETIEEEPSADKTQDEASPEAAAYIIYTSGTSGNPKGTVIQHHHITSLLRNTLPLFSFSASDRWTLFHSFSFDFSVWEMFGALATGASLIIVPEPVIKNAQTFLLLLQEQRVTVLNQTPSAFYQLIREERSGKGSHNSLRYVIFGGESLTADKLREWTGKHPNTQLVNMYGITETTVHVTYKKLDKHALNSGASNIGYLLPHLRAIVVDKDLNLVPRGVPGELWISGESVARGYLGKPELTAQRFLRHPLMGEERYYRSGDLVRICANGEMEYIGRIDQQVKIRGYRIETSEIEQTLRLHPDIEEAVVLPQTDDSGNKELVAYLVTRAAPYVEDIRAFLETSMPSYMIPAYIYEIDAIPLTINGKLDRQALAMNSRRLATQAQFQQPENEMEWLIYRIWKKYMPSGTDYGVNDHILHSGGHSLIASLIINELNSELKTDFTLRAIFENPTIKSLSRYASSRMGQSYQSIPVADTSRFYPCSSVQARMYLHNELAGETTLYNMPIRLELDGPVDPERFKQAVSGLVSRHSVLRTYFERKDGLPVQRILPEVDLSQCVEVVRREQSDLEPCLSGFVQPFRLDAAPLFRVKLILCPGDKHVLLFDLHHLIADGTSLDILLRDLLSLYAGEALAPIPIQYKDYAVWQQQLLSTERMAAHEHYWLEEFREKAPLLSLPLDFARSGDLPVDGDVYTASGGEALFRQLTELANRQGTTLFALLLAAYFVLLHKYSGQEDIVVGAPVDGRDHFDLKQLAGALVNTIALRCRPSGAKTFAQFVDEVKERLLLALEHQRYPFEELVGRLQLSRDAGHHPLFDTWFSVQTIQPPACQHFGIKWKPFSAGVSKFDISLYAVVNDNALEFMWEYRSKLFARDTIARMSAHFQQLLRQIANNPRQTLDEIRLITGEEEHRILHTFNDTALEYRGPRRIHRLFEQMAELYSNQTALISGQASYTFSELNIQSNRLARKLRQAGVGRQSVVGVMLNRTIYLPVGLLAVLKAGGAYLPLDGDYPRDRIQAILRNSRVRMLLAQPEQAEFISSLNYHGDIVYVDDGVRLDEDESNLEDEEEPADLAYVLYTSGTTGSPKGVMIRHDNVLNFIHAMSDRIEFAPGKSILALTTISFDIFFVELLLALCKGMIVLLADEAQQKDPELAHAFLKRTPIHMLQLTPSRVSMFLDNPYGRGILEQAEQILVGGEQFPLALLQQLQRVAKGRIYNLYGPTETTIWSTLQELTASNRIDIGRPLANTSVYVVDHSRQLLPIGVPGELYIAGAGVSSGYYFNEELTGQKFVPDHFAGHGYMYRTGDLVKWLEDGCLMYLGRLDYQIKVRGYRIDIEEVEEALASYPGITNAVIAAQQGEGSSQSLVAYYTAGQRFDSQDIRSFLQDKLPAYMIPGRFARIEAIPLTPNGKIDRKSLPGIGELPVDNEAESIAAPENATERLLAAIWSEVLGAGHVIGVNDNFFDHGGNSLQAGKILLAVQKRTGAALSLRQFFLRPTIRALSGLVQEAATAKALVIPSAEAAKHYPLSPAQKRIYFLQELDGTGISYNMPFVVRIKGKLERERLSQALNQLVVRHESLRTSFTLVDGQPVQQVHEYAKVSLTTATAQSLQELKDRIGSFIKPFSLAQPPLLRVAAVEMQSGDTVFMLDMHHIISDGVSSDIFIEDLLRLYNGEGLPQASAITYKDYSVWQNSLLDSELYRNQEAYWLKTFQGELPVLDLPVDFPRAAVKGYEGSTVSVRVEQPLRMKLQRFASDSDATLNMVMLSAYYALLFRYTWQEDIIVGVPAANRQQEEVQHIIGMFVNTLALRSFPHAGTSVREYIAEVKEIVLQAYENQQYPFENLVENLNLARDLSRNPLFDTMFSFQSKHSQWSADIEAEPVAFEFPVSKFDLSVNVLETPDQLQVEFEYSADLFRPATVQRMIRHYLRMLEGFADNPEATLGDIIFLADAEKHQLLHEFHRSLADNAEDTSFYAVFETVVQQHPHRTAVVFEQEEMTYLELDRKVSQLAQALYDKGAGPNTKVGILIDRSIDMLVGILAALKTGAAYVPLDPMYPAERIHYMLGDCEADILLHQGTAGESIPFAGQRLNINDPGIFAGEGLQRRIPNQPTDLLYIVYTSGSTGKPKGVMIQHDQFMNMCLVWRKEYGLHSPDFSVLQIASISFDVFSGDLGRTLLHGGKLVICSQEDKFDFQRLYRLMERHRITMFESTAAMIVPLMNYIYDKRLDISFLKLLIIGSDVCRVEDYDTLYRRFGSQMRIINSYGVTEAAVDASYFEMNARSPLTGTSVPIGRPLPNVRFYILDERKNMVPVGVTGELYIGGKSVGRGYYGQDRLTQERFLPDPYLPGERMYRTGDRAKWLADGMAEFLGRMDHQVKIRGLRIETGEIENRLRKHARIQEAVVMARQDHQKEPYLCAYYVSGDEIDSLELKDYLAGFLPDYMVPAHFVRLDKMPLSANGKIDNKQFPAPNSIRSLSDERRSEPETELERRLVTIWKTTLSIEEIGIDDNFFDLGGNSMDILRINNRIKEELSLDFTVATLFRYPTIRSFLRQLQSQEDALASAGKDKAALIQEGKHRQKELLQRRRKR
ncbi:amino acid adenylation domain-containing protein [Paenibacillus dendritiformis]|uniref:non-ribosomal peptide synthetase n=1 Tax=Paenibacillus dendritiformis TaxID=130049 RepID=UPI00143D908A|nr:non-ribosomal peptide synthetase [Paenibacillus dendritiformis]NKI21549.1 amino acid adenylation domain-containing protein [Paenibacillus dendritiformis]NRF96382.1 amino acid adenylation domain-containing protein [Paenibacillus dendritiformis]